MSKIVGIRERVHQPLFDTLFIPVPTYPPRYAGEYLRSREQKKRRNAPKRAKSHRVIPVKRSAPNALL